jgi:hypothetical protein
LRALNNFEASWGELSRSELPLAREEPAGDEDAAADEEKTHFQGDVATEKTGHQADRQHDHSDQLEQAADEGAHSVAGRWSPVAAVLRPATGSERSERAATGDLFLIDGDGLDPIAALDMVDDSGHSAGDASEDRVAAIEVRLR